MKKLFILLICVFTQILVYAQVVQKQPEQVSPTQAQEPLKEIKVTEAVKGVIANEQNLMMMAAASSSDDPTPVTKASPAMLTALASPNLYTGTLGIQIPIYTINTQGLSIPIALTYNGGGLKCTDISSQVGAGWDLSAGGRITCMTRNVMDRDTPSDLDRDVYTFNFPGASGIFVIDKTNSYVYTIPYQTLDISWDATMESFTIKDINGFTYKFDAMESDMSASGDYAGCWTTATWFLTEIRGRDSMPIVTFRYSTNEPVQYFYFSGYKKIKAQNGSSIPLTQLQGVTETSTEKDRTLKSQQILTEIVWDGGRVAFDRSNYANEYSNDIRLSIKLDEINVYVKDLATPMRSIVLGHSPFSTSNRRLSLNSISDATSGTPVELYRMSYYDTYDNPDPINYGYADHWGYYRGGTLEYFPSQVWSETGRYTYPGASTERRNPNLAYAQINSLKMIEEVPTGAQKIFEYELHSANNFPDPVGGLRLKSITETDNLNSYSYKTRYEYKNPNGQSSGELFRPNPCNFYVESMQGGWDIKLYSLLMDVVDINGSHIGYSQVKTIHPNGSYTINRFTNYSSGTGYADTKGTLHSNIKDVTNPVTAFNEHVFHKTSRAYKRGLLLETTTYNASGYVVSKIINTYAFGPEKGRVSSLKTIRMKCDNHVIVPVFDIRRSYLVDMGYDWISEPVILQSTTMTVDGQLPVTKSYVYDNTFYLPKEETITSGGQTFVTKIKYPFDYAVSGIAYGPSSAYAIQYMQEKKNLAIPIEKIYYKNGLLIGAEIYLYTVKTISGRNYALPAQKGVLNLQAATSYFTGSWISGSYLGYDSRYEFVENYDEYDRDLRVTSISDNKGNRRSWVYSPNWPSPISSTVNGRTTSYTYSKEGYKTSETDVNGRTTYWEYDNLGRLKKVLDNKRNVIEEYEYTMNQ